MSIFKSDGLLLWKKNDKNLKTKRGTGDKLEINNKIKLILPVFELIKRQLLTANQFAKWGFWEVNDQ